MLNIGIKILYSIFDSRYEIPDTGFMNLSVISKNAGETKKSGRLLAKNLRGGQVFGLIGDLGAGKTTFIQGVGIGFGIKEKIKSPTFVILKRYKIPKHKTIKYLYHIDLYRLSNFLPIGKNLDNLDSDQAQFDSDQTQFGFDRAQLGFDLNEIMQKNSVVFIEWAEKIAPLLPKGWVKIKFEYADKGRRKIIIS